MLALIGPNGAGKTTCFNMVGGQLAPDAGSVKLGGVELVGLQPDAIWRQGVGRTFQIAETFASLTVRENVQLALSRTPASALGFWRAGARAVRAPRPTRCSRSVGMRGAGRAADAACSPTATSSASSWRSRWRTSRACC